MEDKGDFSALPAWLDQVKGMHEKAIAQLGHDAYGLALGGKGKDEMMQKLGESVAQTKGTVEAEQAKILSGKVNGFIQDPASALAAYGSPAEAASHLGQLLKAMTPAQVDAVASAVGVPKNVFGGTNGKVKAVLNKTAAALEGHLAKEKSAKLEALTAGAVDCTKKIFWGKPAKECGSAADVMAALKSLGPAAILAEYPALKKALGLPAVGGGKEAFKAQKAYNNLAAALGAAEAKNAGTGVTSTGLPPHKALKDVGVELAKHDLHKVGPGWGMKNDYGQSYGGIAFSPEGKVLLYQESHGGWGFPKKSSYGDAVSTAQSAVSGKAGATGSHVVGIVPGTYKGAKGDANYLLMQAPGTTAGKGKWFTLQEAEDTIKATLAGSSTKMKKELQLLDAAKSAYTALLNGAKQMPKGTLSMPESAADVAALKMVKPLGGSTGAKLYEDEDGKQYVVKKGSSAGHVKEESAADKAYAAAGFKVPKHALIDTPEGPKKVAEYIDGLKPINQALADAEAAKKAAKGTPGEAAAKDHLEKLTLSARSGFVMDAVLGNWDVVGQGFDNMMADKDGTAWRIDNGGSLRYRAMGALKDKKDFGPTVPEMETLRDGTNKNASQIFGGITDGELSEQAKHLMASKAAILQALPPEVRDTVSQRIDWVAGKYIKAPEQIPGNVMTAPHGGGKWPGGKPKDGTHYAPEASEKGHRLFKDYTAAGDDGKRDSLDHSQLPASFRNHADKVTASYTAGELSAVKDYTGSGYHSLNKAMRKCPETLDCLEPAEQKKAKAIESALAKHGVLETPITVWRHFGLSKATGAADFLPLMQKAMLEGKTVRLPGFKSCSTDPTASAGFSTNGSSHKEVQYALEVRAKTGGYIKPVSKHTSEDEFLLPHGAKYKVVGIKEVQYGGYTKRMTFQLEEVV
jgi:hypothetical protein